MPEKADINLQQGYQPRWGINRIEMGNDHHHKITAYLEGRMTTDEQEAFERQIESNPALLDQMGDHALVEEMRRKLRGITVKQTLSEIRNEKKSPQMEVVHKRMRTRRILYWAVAASFLIAAAYFTWLDQPAFNDQRYYAMLNELEPSETMRKSDAPGDFEKANAAYREGNYAASSRLFGELVASDRSNRQYRMWLGMALMQEKEYSRALEQFESIRTDRFLYRDRVQILKAMALIRLGRKGEAQALLNRLINEGSDYAKEAGKLMTYASP